MILNTTIYSSERYHLIQGSMGCHGDPPSYPTYDYSVASGTDRGNGYQGYYSITYFLTEAPYAPADAKKRLLAILKRKGYTKYLQVIAGK